MHSSKLPLMSRTCRKPTVTRGTRSNSNYSKLHPLGIPQWDAIKERYYPIRNYDYIYMKWTTMWQGRGLDVPSFTNIYHTLHMKLHIKASKWHLVLKFSGCIHKYIQYEMEFLDISSLALLINMLSRSRKNLNKRRETLDLWIQSKVNAPPIHRKNEKSKVGWPRTTH